MLVFGLQMIPKGFSLAYQYITFGDMFKSGVKVHKYFQVLRISLIVLLKFFGFKISLMFTSVVTHTHPRKKVIIRLETLIRVGV